MDLLERVGAYVGLASFLGLAVLALLYFSQARDVRRLNGKCLVVTGTAAVLKGGMLRQISRGRLDGSLPSGDGRGGIYDVHVTNERGEQVAEFSGHSRTVKGTHLPE